MRKVEVELNIKTTPDRVIDAFINPEMLRIWWNVERTLIDARPGGTYLLGWNITESGIGFISTGVVKEYENGRRLVIGNYTYCNPQKQFLGPMSLTIKVAPVDDGLTRFYLCQDGYRSGGDWDWYYDAVKDAWPTVAKTLKEYLER